jgi:hypothetical protein
VSHSAAGALFCTVDEEPGGADRAFLLTIARVTVGHRARVAAGGAGSVESVVRLAGRASIIGRRAADAIIDVAAQAQVQGGGDGKARIALLADVVEHADGALFDCALHASTSIGWVVALVAGPTDVWGTAGGALANDALGAGRPVEGGVVELHAGAAYVRSIALEAFRDRALVADSDVRDVSSDAVGAFIGCAAVDTVIHVAKNAGLTSRKNVVASVTVAANSSSCTVRAVFNVTVHTLGCSQVEFVPQRALAACGGRIAL